MSREADDYSPFSEDANGRLIRVQLRTIEDLTRELALIVDGVPLKAFAAKLQTDSQGNPLQDDRGFERVRSTTILDVIHQATDYAVGLIRWLRDYPAAKREELSPEAATNLLDRRWRRGEEAAFLAAVVAESRYLPRFGCEVLERLIKLAVLPAAVAVRLRPNMVRENVQDGEDVGPELETKLRWALEGRILLPPCEDFTIPRVPVLCHQDHLDPVAVCRVCSVRVFDWGKGRGSRGLVPACQHRAEPNMAVYTIWSAGHEAWEPLQRSLGPELQRTGVDVATLRRKADGNRIAIRQSVATLAELLTAQCWHPEREPERAGKYENGLAALWRTLNAQAEAFGVAGTASTDHAQGEPIPRETRFVPQPATRKVAWRPNPVTGVRASPETFADKRHFMVDYDSCILCDRCVRSCGDVRGFHVLGRTGKGAGTHIAFDLDGLSMAASSCYACGECMKACPTGAITFLQPVLPVGSPAWNEDLRVHHATVPADDELQRRHPRFFAKLPVAFRRWNHGAVRRRELAVGEVLVREGEFGNVAYITETARLAVLRRQTSESIGAGAKSACEAWRESAMPRDRQAELERELGVPVAVLTRPDLIAGEMSVMTHDRRTASMVVIESGTILELDRNVLYEFFRIPELRKEIEAKYAAQALDNFRSDHRHRAPSRENADRGVRPAASASARPPAARKSLYDDFTREELAELFAMLTAGENTRLVFAEPGDVICSVNDAATDFFFVHQGFVKLEIPTLGAREVAVSVGTVPGLCGQGEFFGDFALLKVAERWLQRESAGEVITNPAADEEFLREARRSATVRALDAVELFRLPLFAVAEYLKNQARRGSPILTKMRGVHDRMLSAVRNPSGTDR